MDISHFRVDWAVVPGGIFALKHAAAYSRVTLFYTLGSHGAGCRSGWGEPGNGLCVPQEGCGNGGDGRSMKNVLIFVK